jgi:hypothetical protein
MALLMEHGTMDIVCKVVRLELTKEEKVISLANKMIEDFYENQLFTPFIMYRSSFQCIISRNPMGFYEALIVPRRKSKCNNFAAKHSGSIIKKSYRDHTDGLWKFYINWSDSFSYQDLALVSAKNMNKKKPQLYESTMKKPFYTFDDVFQQVEDVVAKVLLPVHRGRSPSISPIPKFST